MLWHLLKEIRVVSLVGCRAPNRFHFECSFCGLFQLKHSHRALVSLNSVFKGLHIVFLIIWMTEIGVMLSFFRYLFSHFYSHCLFFSLWFLYYSMSEFLFPFLLIVSFTLLNSWYYYNVHYFFFCSGLEMRSFARSFVRSILHSVWVISSDADM